MRAKKIIIVGAGMGGLTLAIALMQRGFEVRVHEQSAALGELGAGLTVPVTSMRVFDALGLWEKVRAITDRSAGMTYVHYQTREIFHGSIDHEWSLAPERGQGGQTERAALHSLLRAEVHALDPEALVLGHRLADVHQDAESVAVKFENGDEARGDLLVCCDGVRSAGHRAIFGLESPATFTGHVAIRCMIPREKVEPYLSGGRSMKFVGPHRGFSRYGIKRGSLINCVALAKADAWREEGWSHPCSREELLDLYKGFHRDVIGLIENAPEHNIFKWALYDREPLTNWTVGRATLLGDAAHPMLPYLAQGATAAIEDALVLARALQAHDDHASAFAVYQANRIPRTTTQMRSSRDQASALDQADPYRYAARRSDPAAMNVYDPVTVPV